MSIKINLWNSIKIHCNIPSIQSKTSRLHLLKHCWWKKIKTNPTNRMFSLYSGSCYNGTRVVRTRGRSGARAWEARRRRPIFFFFFAPHWTLDFEHFRLLCGIYQFRTQTATYTRHVHTSCNVPEMHRSIKPQKKWCESSIYFLMGSTEQSWHVFGGGILSSLRSPGPSKWCIYIPPKSCFNSIPSPWLDNSQKLIE